MSGGIMKPMLDAAFEKFKDQSETGYYAEWFWWPNSKKCWTNCWKDDGDRKDAREYPSPIAVKFQEILPCLMEFANNTIFRVLPSQFQMRLLTSSWPFLNCHQGPEIILL